LKAVKGRPQSQLWVSVPGPDLFEALLQALESGHGLIALDECLDVALGASFLVDELGHRCQILIEDMHFDLSSPGHVFLWLAMELNDVDPR